MNPQPPPEDHPSKEHREAAQSIETVAAAVLTISDTRTEETDTSGSILRDTLAEHGHTVACYEILKDDPPRIRERTAELCDGEDCDVVLLTGGTGIAPRDGTVEAISGLFDRSLPGFGELFRMLSFEEIGAAAMLSRAVAGIRSRTAIFCMPGSSAAVRLAMTRLIVPELRHLIHQLRK